jgi:hypothetical protein
MVVKWAFICRPPLSKCLCCEGKSFLMANYKTRKRSLEEEEWLVHFILQRSELYTSMFLLILWLIYTMVCTVYSFTCGCRSFHEMEIPIMENCLSSVTLASAVIMAIFIYGILYHQYLSLVQKYDGRILQLQYTAMVRCDLSLNQI